MDPAFLERAVRVAAAYDAADDLQFIIVDDAGYWAGYGNTEGRITVAVNCNDLFYWATADLEPIETDDDLKLLEECLKLDDSYGLEIYACRKRKMRPQTCVLEDMTGETRRHFEACGPPRTHAECG